MGRIQGLTDTLSLTGSQIIKSVEGYIFSMTIAWAGATAGNKMYLRDGVLGDSPVRVCIVLGAVTGTMQLNWPQGKKFDNGIYYDEGTAANCFVDLTYK